MSASPWPHDPHSAAAAARPTRLATIDPPGRVVAVRSAHGGAGATTVAAHLAGAWARWGPRPVGVVDLAGGLAQRLDLPPGVRTWTDLADPVDQPDDQVLLEAFTQPWPGMWVLPLTGLVDGGQPEPAPDPALVRTMVAAGRRAFQVLVADLPPAGGPQVDAALALADLLLAVGRCHSAGVRGARVALDLWTAAGRNQAAAGAVITGVRSRAPLAPREARAVLGERLWALVPDDAAEFAVAAEDGMLLLDHPELPAVQALITLANRVVPFPTPPG
jgi:Flp pilus assembly CpaE family ATPase